MNNIAFFVEGQTEKIFIEQLLKNVIAEEKLNFIKLDNLADLYRIIKNKTQNDNNGYGKYNILIYNVGANNNTVASSILEAGRELLEKYNIIFAICDLYEKCLKREDKKRVLNSLYNSINRMWFVITDDIIDTVFDGITSRQKLELKSIKDKKFTKKILINKLNSFKLHRNVIDEILKPMEQNKSKFEKNIVVILAVMETEAWFLADYNLFSKINPLLTSKYIKQELGKDLIKDDPEEDYDKPTKLIKDIYNLVGKKYKKHEDDSYEITHRINYDYLCLDTKGKKVRAFHLLLDKIEGTLN